MLFYLVRFAINAVAIALTVWLLPGITVVDNNVWTYLWLALILALINAFVRPVVLLFTGQWIIATMGLMIFIVNGLMLFLLTLLLPSYIQISGILPIVLGGALIALIATALETILGLTQPVSLSRGATQTQWYGMDRFAYGSKRIMENLRLQQIYQTFYEYGLDIAVERSSLADIRHWMQEHLYGTSSEQSALTVPAKTRLMLQELGPVYVKMGQIVSSQAQALPLEWQEELAKLQSNVPPFPADEARQILITELGKPPEEVFDLFEAEPFAAASTAQVHRALLPGGERVVVKVQRPNIIHQVRADLGIMHNVAETLEKRTNWAKEYNLTAMLDEYAKHMLEELDYRNEIFNAMQLGQNLQIYEKIHVPKVYPALSTSRVLTMEFAEGVKITNLAAIDEGGLDRKVLAENFVRSIVKQLIFDGFFHADPHPGNVLVNIHTGTITFLDMGMMGTLNREQKLDLADLIISLYMADLKDLGRVIVRLSTPFKPFDEQGFYRQLERQIGRYFLVIEGSNSISNVMGTTLALMHEYGLRLNQDLTLAVKAMIQAEEAALTLDPNVEFVNISIQESQALLSRRIDSGAVVEMVTKEGIRSLKEVVRRLPTLQTATMKWLEQYERGRFTVELDTSDLSRQIGVFSGAIQSLAVGFILVGIVLGTALAVVFTEQTAGGVYWLFLALFCAALLVSIVIGWRIIRRMTL